MTLTTAADRAEDVRVGVYVRRAGVIDVLLVYRVDRLTRRLRDLVTLLDDLDHAGVVFRSATEPFDTATAMGRILVQMLGMFAHHRPGHRRDGTQSRRREMEGRPTPVRLPGRASPSG